jgi:hypothetical protein
MEKPRLDAITELCDSSFGTAYLPKLANGRAKCRYDGTVVPFLDMCSAHVGYRLRGLWQANRVLPRRFPIYNSNQLQPLDLSLFGITKRYIAKVNKLDAVNIQTKHIASIVWASLAAAVPLDVVRCSL